ncbi:RNA polymerase sigma factor [Erythrobacter sp. W302b]|uniref:RNA polymerase sigma factor n=1 Tax=Erythrobacter sp. W302b TaxID=3389874 RepID=UPI00396B0E4D
MSQLDDIIRDYGASLARIAASYEADKVLQEDLRQDMLLAIHQALPRLRSREKLAPFLFRIAHNRGVSHVIRESEAKRRKTQSLPSADPETPEARLIESDRSRQLAAAVRRLPLPYRQVITLVLEELAYMDIAEALGISVSNVGVRIKRAKALLKEMLDE